VIRVATLDDAPAIARVHVRTWEQAYAHVFPPAALAARSIEDREARWREWLEGGDAAIFVGEVRGEVVGFASAGESGDFPGSGELHAIYVEAEHWGGGVGPALLDRAEAELRARGFDRAVLLVLADNPRARRFYARHGWVPDEPFPEVIRGQEVEVVWYRKDLTHTDPAGV
jgi:GNAT superfamily N-acetyltransferase